MGIVRKIAVAIAQKTGLYKWAVSVETKLSNKKKQRYFKKYGLEALVQADRAFRSVNSILFLDFGTLLGAYREKNFIAHDCDIDLGYLHDSAPENMPELLAAYGFKHKMQFYIKETGLIVEDRYTYKGVQVDFFPHFKSGTSFYCYLGRQHETKSPEEANRTDGFPCKLSWVDATDFSEYEFLGQKFYVPNNTAKWLESVYGADFMTPIKKKYEDSHVVKTHTERIFRRYF